jgi:putative membrane protein
MPKGFVTDEAKTALADAIKAIERRSAAEVVIAVRARSASYLHADLMFAILGGLVTVGFLLYSSWSFPLWSFLVDPILVGALFGLLSSQLAPLRRWLTPQAVREEWVARAARATFFEKGVRHTADRTGILVYVSLTERHVELVADSGVENAVDPRDWAQKVARIQQVVADGGDGVALAAAIERLGDTLEPALERAHDDINELPDEVCA